jgi:hypothetical protein
MGRGRRQDSSAGMRSTCTIIGSTGRVVAAPLAGLAGGQLHLRPAAGAGLGEVRGGAGSPRRVGVMNAKTRGPVAGHECSPGGPTATPRAPAAPTARADHDQARHAAQTGHPDAHLCPVGWADPRLHGGGSGGAWGVERRGRVLIQPEHARRRHALERVRGPAQSRSGQRLGRRGVLSPALAVAPARLGLRQWRRVHQRQPLALLRATADHVHPVATLARSARLRQEGPGPGRAEELDHRAPIRRL